MTQKKRSVAEIKTIQRRLKAEGYNLGTTGKDGVDGDFGAKTSKAFEASKKASGIPAGRILQAPKGIMGDSEKIKAQRKAAQDKADATKAKTKVEVDKLKKDVKQTAVKAVKGVKKVVSTAQENFVTPEPQAGKDKVKKAEKVVDKPATKPDAKTSRKGYSKKTEDLQKELNRQGAKLEADGLMGNKTRAAVKKYKDKVDSEGSPEGVKAEQSDNTRVAPRAKIISDPKQDWSQAAVPGQAAPKVLRMPSDAGVQTAAASSTRVAPAPVRPLMSEQQAMAPFLKGDPYARPEVQIGPGRTEAPVAAPPAAPESQIPEDSPYKEINSSAADIFRGMLPLPGNASQMLAKTVLGDARMSNSSITDRQKVILWDVIQNAKARSGKNTGGGTEYADYGNMGHGSPKQFNEWFNRGGVSPGALVGQSATNAGFKLASTIGRGRYWEDEKDPETMYYTDVYDWNSGERDFSGAGIYKTLRNLLRGGEDKHLNAEKNNNYRMNFKLNKSEIDAMRSAK